MHKFVPYSKSAGTKEPNWDHWSWRATLQNKSRISVAITRSKMELVNKGTSPWWVQSSNVECNQFLLQNTLRMKHTFEFKDFWSSNNLGKVIIKHNGPKLWYTEQNICLFLIYKFIYTCVFNTWKYVILKQFCGGKTILTLNVIVAENPIQGLRSFNLNETCHKSLTIRWPVFLYSSLIHLSSVQSIPFRR